MCQHYSRNFSRPTVCCLLTALCVTWLHVFLIFDCKLFQGMQLLPSSGSNHPKWICPNKSKQPPRGGDAPLFSHLQLRLVVASGRDGAGDQRAGRGEKRTSSLVWISTTSSRACSKEGQSSTEAPAGPRCCVSMQEVCQVQPLLIVSHQFYSSTMLVGFSAAHPLAAQNTLQFSD